MKNKVKVSACIITYNHEQFIRQCLEGAINQKVNYDYEIVIGDDNSNDKTREICLQYVKKYPNLIKFFHREKNLGMVGNWIKSIQNCTGSYIAICEGDDYWTDPLKLQKQVDFLEDNSNYGMSFTTCDRYYQEQDVYIKANAEKKNREELTFESLLFSNPIRTCTTVIRGSLIKQFVRLMGSEIINLKMVDAPLWLFIAMNHKIKLHKENTAVYRILEKSATNVSAYKKLLFRMSRYKVSWFFLQKRFSFPIATKLFIVFLKETPILIIKTFLSFLNLYKPNKEKVINRYN